MIPAPGFVQSCITTVSFPKTLPDVHEMVEKNYYAGKWIADMDILLNFDSGLGTSWTAPKWMTSGDILFFYHTKAAQQRTTKLLQEVRSSFMPKKHLLRLLERSQQLAETYSGTLFGCATVSGATEYRKIEEAHFKGRNFAPLGQIHIFDNPLSFSALTDIIKMGQNTTTPLYKPQFEAIRQSLAIQNRLPVFLEKADFGDMVFRNANQENWPLISCRPEVRFINENQIRTYLLDFVLDELKDQGTPLLKECACLRSGREVGFADYFVNVHGFWLPVEAKLNILAEKDVLAQTTKYVNLDSFSSKKRKYEASKLGLCLVMDQSGIYVVVNNQFMGCTPGRPVWSREQLDHETISVIRDHIKTYL